MPHLIVTAGGWLRSAVFLHGPAPPKEILEKLFRRKLFKLLPAQEAVSEYVVEGMLQSHHSGFDVFVGEEIPGHDKDALESLAQYIAKKPVSLQNLEYSTGQSETYCHSKTRHPRHGSCRTFDPPEFLAELTSHIARPFERLHNYHGFHSNASRGTPLKMQEISQDASTSSQTGVSAPTPLSRKSWARLIKKVCEIDPLLCQCGGKLKPIALIEDPDVIYRILNHCNLLETETHV
jgi:hypothetical protein